MNYEELIREIEALVGPGRQFRNVTEMARYCGVETNYFTRHFKAAKEGEERGRQLVPFLSVLDKLGVRIVFPGREPVQYPNAAGHQAMLQLKDELSAAKDKIIGLLEQKAELEHELQALKAALGPEEKRGYEIKKSSGLRDEVRESSRLFSSSGLPLQEGKAPYGIDK